MNWDMINKKILCLTIHILFKTFSVAHCSKIILINQLLQLDTNNTKNMKLKLIFFTISLLFFQFIYSQNYTVSGYITDAASGETMISGSVFDGISRKGTVSNVYGFYSLTLPSGNVEINYTYVGYSSQIKTFKLRRDTIINIKLNESIELKEVTVTGSHREIGVKGSQMSAIDVPINLIKSVPTIFGEADVIKALQLLPGVQAGVEGSAGFYVRGGGPDENLFLLDGVPVYNVNHLGGFFSVFNPDAVKNVTLYKGSFPARFGGRLSSVVDIRMNDGNNKKLKGNFSIGLISSKLNLEGPLFSENTTFNISARRTYLDVLVQPFFKLAAMYENGNSENQDVNMSAGYYFYDLNAKISHKFSENDRLYLSAYLGDDAVYADMRQSYREFKNRTEENRFKLNWDWGNIITALRWNHIINNKLFMNTTATYTRYRFNMDVGTTIKETIKNPPSTTTMNTDLGYKSGIYDAGMKVDFDYAPNPNHDIKFGVQYTYHTFRPGISVAQYKFQNDTSVQKMDTTIGNNDVLSNESALYFEDNININNYLKVNAGLHYSTFYVQKQFYHSLQPRIGARLLITDKLSAKAGYAAMNQYIHLLSNNTISLPTDLWVPVTKRIEPMRSHQVSAGIFYNLMDIFDLSIEGYYKTMHNLIEYKDGATFLGSTTGWEDKVSIGEGWAYGMEFLAQKSFGKTTGWIGYTWAKSERLFNRPGQELNNGLVFPAKYDRRHDVSIVVAHKFSERIDIAATWVYSTGNAATLGLQNYLAYPVPGNEYDFSYGYMGSVPYIDKRNNYRYPDYSRLDLGVNFNKKLKHGIRTWNISVYNAYNQMNPFLMYTSYKSDYNSTNDEFTYKKVFAKLTLFPIIPSISYSYKF